MTDQERYYAERNNELGQGMLSDRQCKRIVMENDLDANVERLQVEEDYSLLEAIRYTAELHYDSASREEQLSYWI